MKNKTLIYECNCIHCQQKQNQINNAKLYFFNIGKLKNFFHTNFIFVYITFIFYNAGKDSTN